MADLDGCLLYALRDGETSQAVLEEQRECSAERGVISALSYEVAGPFLSFCSYVGSEHLLPESYTCFDMQYTLRKKEIQL